MRGLRVGKVAAPTSFPPLGHGTGERQTVLRGAAAFYRNPLWNRKEILLVTHRRSSVRFAAIKMAGVVVITGASAGVGRAAALKFARSGFDVALLARGHARLESAASEARGLGVAALPIALDLA